MLHLLSKEIRAGLVRAALVMAGVGLFLLAHGVVVEGAVAQPTSKNCSDARAQVHELSVRVSGLKSQLAKCRGEEKCAAQVRGALESPTQELEAAQARLRSECACDATLGELKGLRGAVDKVLVAYRACGSDFACSEKHRVTIYAMDRQMAEVARRYHAVCLATARPLPRKMKHYGAAIGGGGETGDAGEMGGRGDDKQDDDEDDADDADDEGATGGVTGGAAGGATGGEGVTGGGRAAEGASVTDGEVSASPQQQAR